MSPHRATAEVGAFHFSRYVDSGSTLMISRFMLAFFVMPGATWPDALVPMQYIPAAPAESCRDGDQAEPGRSVHAFASLVLRMRDAGHLPAPGHFESWKMMPTVCRRPERKRLTP